MIKNIRYLIEAIFLYLIMTVFRILPLDAASSLGGAMGKFIGLRLGVTKRADKHLRLVFPDMTEERRREVIRDMWDNLGRVIAEYPHLQTIGASRITMINEPAVKDTVLAGKGGMFVSAHIGNWEAHVPAMLARYGVAASLTYRGLNNPYADAILRQYRTLHGRIDAWPKVRESAKNMIQKLKSGGFVAMLIDQKFNEGIAASFFGRPAMTNPAYAQLSQKYNCPLVMVRCKRLKGAHFELIAHDPLPLFDANGAPLPIKEIIESSHRILEQWITDSPEQWLWLHRRWDSSRLNAEA